MKGEFVIKGKKQPIFKCFKAIIKPFYKCQVICEEEVPEKAIVISNHSAKIGPMAMEINYPKYNYKWGAHQMLGNYASRYNYLRNVLYIQKCKTNKVSATLKSIFEALFSKMVYKGMKVMPTYQDVRQTKTIKNSMTVLDNNISVMIFPENSNSGYFDELTELFAGFVILAEQYYKKTGEDVPVIPAYYHRKSRKLIVGKKRYVQQLKNSGLSRDDICEFFRKEINDLYYKYVLNK